MFNSKHKQGSDSTRHWKVLLMILCTLKYYFYFKYALLYFSVVHF